MTNRKQPTYEYQIVVEDFDFEPFPLTLPNGNPLWGVATVTVDFNADLDSWDYPDAANTRREEITIGDIRVSIELSDITAFDVNGEEVPATEELRRHLIDSFPVHKFRDEMLEQFENDNDPWNSCDDDPRE